jgi:hypothetical protein
LSALANLWIDGIHALFYFSRKLSDGIEMQLETELSDRQPRRGWNIPALYFYPLTG